MKEINSEVKIINEGLLRYSMAKIKMVMKFQASKNRRGVIAQMYCCSTPICSLLIREIETFLFYGRGFNSLKLVSMSSNELCLGTSWS